jgi:hypothetical protein
MISLSKLFNGIISLTKNTKAKAIAISDDASSHRSTSKTRVKLLIIDGDFLKG